MGNISFVIQSAEIKTGSNKFFKSIKDPKTGTYKLPGFVFDQPSRNKKLYDTNSMVDCITNPNTRFYRMLTEGGLHGEWGHPKTDDFSRLTTIDENNYALWIKKVWVDTLKTGETVMWVEFKPCGPKGQFFEEALEDPDRNASLSIRVACVDGPTRNGISTLFPKCLVTTDAVGSGGFQAASKRTAIEHMSMEDFIISFSENDLTENVAKNLVYMENYNKDSILEYFRADSIKVTNQIITPSIQAASFHKSFIY